MNKLTALRLSRLPMNIVATRSEFRRMLNTKKNIMYNVVQYTALNGNQYTQKEISPTPVTRASRTPTLHRLLRTCYNKGHREFSEQQRT